MYQHQYNRQLPTDWFHQVESLSKLTQAVTFDFELRDFILPSDHRLVEAELERVRKARRGEPSAVRRQNLSDNAAQAILAAGGRVEHDWVGIHEAWWRRFGETFYRNPDDNPFACEYLQSSWWHCLPNREKDVILLWDQKQALTPDSVEEFICIDSTFGYALCTLTVDAIPSLSSNQKIWMRRAKRLYIGHEKAACQGLSSSDMHAPNDAYTIPANHLAQLVGGGFSFFSIAALFMCLCAVVPFYGNK